MNFKTFKKGLVLGVTILAICGLSVPGVFAQAVPGGTLDPLTIPKYVTPLVIPPVMDVSVPANCDGTPADPDCNVYDIAVRQFQQQILPAPLPPTMVWSYGPAADPTPAVAPDPNSQFNYPAYTVETTVSTTTTVSWINDLVTNPDACKVSANPATDPACNFLSHLLPIDRSLHWANPEQLTCMDPAKTKDCRPDPVANGLILQQPYLGPVPIITHVHGAHVGPESDGYPESWYLPDANNIPAGYATEGTLVNSYTGLPLTNVIGGGVANFSYPNTQPSTTLWYHDHTLGMTRNNVYAGPAGFWLIRERDAAGDILQETGLVFGTLPGPAPVAGQAVLDLNSPGNPVRVSIREIPIVIQDRSFNIDGSLFYPNNRAFFEGINPNNLKIPFIGDATYPSDISPIWNPEFFGNVIVVNGVSWPTLEVEPDLYRFRLLNGSNSRFLNLSLQALDAAGAVLGEVPFYQIGAEQSLLPKVVKIATGFRTALPGDGTNPPLTANPACAVPGTCSALLMGLAERADVIVDFSTLPAGTASVRMLNTAPDAPFGGFPDPFVADPATTGQVMEFVLVAETGAGEGFTPPEDLVLSLPDSGDPATGGIQTTVRDMALLEEESASVCVTISPNGVISYDKKATPDPANPGTCTTTKGKKIVLAKSVPFAPKAAVLGINGSAGGTPTLWSSPIETRPALNATETWELWNWTVDGHPIHLHLVKFKVLGREIIGTGSIILPELTEAGWKDTVIAYPGEVTRLNATFDIAGLYVWHCHIVEHEDNEMMVPYCVGDPNANGCNAVP